MVRIPLVWRIMTALFAVATLICGGTIYIVRSASHGYTCLENYDTIVDSERPQSFSKWIYSFSYGQRYPVSLTTHSPGPVYLGTPAFSWIKSGTRMAHLDYYMAQDGSGLAQGWVSIDSPAENIHVRLPTTVTAFPFYAPYGNPEFVWSDAPNDYLAPTEQLSWSPDGHFVLLQYYGRTPGSTAAETWQFSLFGIDGSSMLNVATLKQDPTTLSLSRVVWSADSRFLIFPHSVDTVQSWAFDTKTGLNYPLGSQDLALIQHSRLALPQLQDGTTTISMMDVDGTHRTPLIENAVDAGDPNWSPDGKHVAVVWSSGQGNKRVVRLTLSNADGSNLHVLDDGFWDIHDLRWLSDGRSLAYVAQRNSGTTVEIVDLGTGAYRQISTNPYQDIAELEESPVTRNLTFWWRTTTHQIGIDTYKPDGLPVYHTPLALNITGLELFRSAFDWIASPEIFRSPDGSTYAIRLSSTIYTIPIGLEMIAADGSWSKTIQLNYPGTPTYYPLSAPLWSPDSKTLAFGNFISYNPMLTILRADGTHVSDIPSLFETRGLSWTQCN